MPKGPQQACLTLALIGLVLSLGGAGDAAAQNAGPAQLPALYRRADSLLRARRFEAARGLFERLAGADPLNQAYWLGLGDSERADWDGPNPRSWPSAERWR